MEKQLPECNKNMFILLREEFLLFVLIFSNAHIKLTHVHLTTNNLSNKTAISQHNAC